jgi:hypothetical protein
MTQTRRYYKCKQKARQRRLQRGRGRRQHEQARPHHHLQALEHAVQKVGLPGTIHLSTPKGPIRSS